MLYYIIALLSSALAAHLKPHGGMGLTEWITRGSNAAADWRKVGVEPPKLRVCVCEVVVTRFSGSFKLFGLSQLRFTASLISEGGSSVLGRSGQARAKTHSPPHKKKKKMNVFHGGAWPTGPPHVCYSGKGGRAAGARPLYENHARHRRRAQTRSNLTHRGTRHFG